MIQRVFYGDLGPKPEKIAGWDLDGREHLALWPTVALFLVMGVAPPIWLKAIDGAVVTIADHSANALAVGKDRVLKLEAETYRPANSAAPTGVGTAFGGAH
jgi:NADH-quinone oxidoreductase subunit M